MPSYEITVGAQTITVVRAGADNPGRRRLAFNDAIALMGISTARGVHCIMVPDGNDAAATIVVIPDGQHGGSWVETPAPRVRPAQVQAQVRAR